MTHDKVKHIIAIIILFEYTVPIILKDSIIIHRLSADSSLKDLIGPMWTRKKLVVMNEIDKKLRKEKLYQGKGLAN